MSHRVADRAGCPVDPVERPARKRRRRDGRVIQPGIIDRVVRSRDRPGVRIGRRPTDHADRQVRRPVGAAARGQLLPVDRHIHPQRIIHGDRHRVAKPHAHRVGDITTHLIRARHIRAREGPRGRGHAAQPVVGALASRIEDGPCVRVRRRPADHVRRDRGLTRPPAAGGHPRRTGVQSAGGHPRRTRAQIPHELLPDEDFQRIRRDLPDRVGHRADDAERADAAAADEPRLGARRIAQQAVQAVARLVANRPEICVGAYPAEYRRRKRRRPVWPAARDDALPVRGDVHIEVLADGQQDRVGNLLPARIRHRAGDAVGPDRRAAGKERMRCTGVVEACAVELPVRPRDGPGVPVRRSAAPDLSGQIRHPPRATARRQVGAFGGDIHRQDVADEDSRGDLGQGAGRVGDDAGHLIRAEDGPAGEDRRVGRYGGKAVALDVAVGVGNGPVVRVRRDAAQRSGRQRNLAGRSAARRDPRPVRRQVARKRLAHVQDDRAADLLPGGIGDPARQEIVADEQPAREHGIGYVEGVEPVVFRLAARVGDGPVVGVGFYPSADRGAKRGGAPPGGPATRRKYTRTLARDFERQRTPERAAQRRGEVRRHTGACRGRKQRRRPAEHHADDAANGIAGGRVAEHAHSLDHPLPAKRTAWRSVDRRLNLPGRTPARHLAIRSTHRFTPCRSVRITQGSTPAEALSVASAHMLSYSN